jgi:hypothetical protein
MSDLQITQHSACELVRAAPAAIAQPINAFDPRGKFSIDLYRDGKRINSFAFPNGIVNQGKNHLLDVGFYAATAYPTWYCGLIDLSGYSELADDDTYTDINQAGNGWDEYTSYTDANNGDSATTRPEWQADAASAQAITNSTTSIFDITVNGTVKGVFIVGGTGGAANKSDHEAANNILWATALFGSGDVAVLNGDQLKVTYTISA